MNRDKQIEEMTEALCDIEGKGIKCNTCDRDCCEYRMLAEALYNAGYRKASEVARGIFEEIEDSFDKMIDEATNELSSARLECDLKAIKLLEYHIDVLHMVHRTLIRELKKKYTEGGE